MENLNMVEKPKDWPANDREFAIERVSDVLNSFIESPNYETKELLSSLCIQNDLNEFSSRGLFRFTEYEIAMYNEIYLNATSIGFHDIKIFLYRCLYDVVVGHKMVNMMMRQENDYLAEIKYLFPELQLFYYSYFNMRQYKNGWFVDELINVVDIWLRVNDVNEVLRIFLSFINDISYNKSKKVFPILNFSRSEIKKIYKKIIEISNKAKINPLERPFKGVFKLSLINLILNSRNTNSEYLYKCVSDNTAKASLKNQEVWMSEIKKLNDKREEKAISSLFQNKQWIKYDWAKKVSLKPRTTCFVTCFSKKKPSKRMKKDYGNNVYGFKSERMAGTLSPIWLNKKYPCFSYVVAFDVIYERKVLEQELNYLCDIINNFDISNNDKNKLYNEFLQYWLLSYKDKKWSHEKEKRFQLFIYPDDYEYLDIIIEKGYLKLKSTLFLYPDFVLTNINHPILKENILIKANAIARDNYLFCENCLQVSYDYVLDDNEICDICGNKRVKKTTK